MQKKGIVISFIIVVLIWIGYMVVRHLNMSKEVEDTNKDTYAKLTEIAKKSPNGGLIHMARILNKYNAEKGTYPQTLMDLYPDYLPSEAHIREIEWDYQRTDDNNFSLKKTITANGMQRITVVDKNLRIGTVRSTAVAQVDNEAFEDESPSEELGVMVASAGPASESAEGELSEAEAEEAGETEPEEGPEETLRQLISTGPEIVSVAREEIAPGVDPQLENTYLVWKDEKGRLGFGNVDYPSSYRLSVYSNGAYQTIRRPAPLERKSGVTDLTDHEKTPDEIASSMEKQILVWRNKDGTLGFGNVDYPKGDNVSHINVDGEWEKKRQTQP